MPDEAREHGWGWRLELLRQALDQLTALREEWHDTRDHTLPPDAGPGTPAYDKALDTYQSECWSYLVDWSAYGPALPQINEATARPPLPSTTTARPPRKPTKHSPNR
ncbi:hypothetical protein [Streptomyces sp. GZWMJZ-114]|uniref:hypothetical protein n=1 Tax=Streptomyces sp. GZWMJZ-114 TaxID=2494734 RepID=UPI001011B838|nr:hypothetical protein [Streptomyces sp. GZWMJZ-114]